MEKKRLALRSSFELASLLNKQKKLDMPILIYENERDVFLSWFTAISSVWDAIFWSKSCQIEGNNRWQIFGDEKQRDTSWTGKWHSGLVG